jgi:hypothetical protein
MGSKCPVLHVKGKLCPFGFSDVCWCRRVMSLAQLVSTAVIGWRFADDLPFCMTLQTMTFVALNKVLVNKP